jgi:hypothetical protein
MQCVQQAVSTVSLCVPMNMCPQYVYTYEHACVHVDSTLCTHVHGYACVHVDKCVLVPSARVLCIRVTCVCLHVYVSAH